MLLRQYRTNELVRWRMHFLSDAIAEIEGLLEVNRDFCKKQMAEKASPALPTNCAVVPLMLQRVSPLRRRGGCFPLAPSTPSGCTPMFFGFYRKFYGSFPYRFPNQHNKPVTWACAAKGSRGRSQTSSVSIAPLSHPQTRNLRAADKFYLLRHHRTIRRRVWRCLFRHLRHANFSIYLQ